MTPLRSPRAAGRSCLALTSAGFSVLASLGLLGAAHAQMGTPPPARPPEVRSPAPMQPAPPMQTVPPIQSVQPVPPPAPLPGTRPAPSLPGQPPTRTGPAPLEPFAPQITIPLTRPPPPGPPAGPAPPTLQRSGNEPRAETLTRCNALANVQAQAECRRRAGVHYRAP